MKKVISNINLRKNNKISIKRKVYLTLWVIYMSFTPTVVYAGIDATWNVLMETIFLYVPKIGITMIVYGGIEFAIANTTEDAYQKIRATRFMVSGAIVLSVITVLKPYLL